MLSASGKPRPQPRGGPQDRASDEELRALFHELVEPLTALSNYVEVARRALLRSEAQQTDCPLAEILDKSAVQASRATEVVRRIFALLESELAAGE